MKEEELPVSSNALALKDLPSLGYRNITAVGRKEFEDDVRMTEKVCRVRRSNASHCSDAEDGLSRDWPELETCELHLTD